MSEKSTAHSSQNQSPSGTCVILSGRQCMCQPSSQPSHSSICLQHDMAWCTRIRITSIKMNAYKWPCEIKYEYESHSHTTMYSPVVSCTSATTAGCISCHWSCSSSTAGCQLSLHHNWTETPKFSQRRATGILHRSARRTIALHKFMKQRCTRIVSSASPSITVNFITAWHSGDIVRK